jgi:hypothetical protein
MTLCFADSELGLHHPVSDLAHIKPPFPRLLSPQSIPSWNYLFSCYHTFLLLVLVLDLFIQAHGCSARQISLRLYHDCPL